MIDEVVFLRGSLFGEPGVDGSDGKLFDEDEPVIEMRVQFEVGEL
jgi:hypothetical protein